jgi:hypothetical protein
VFSERKDIVNLRGNPGPQYIQAAKDSLTADKGNRATKPRPSTRLSIEDVGKFVGLLGVVGSLLFVGLQVRQNSIATQAATNAAVADGFREFNMMMASSPDLARAFAQYAARPEEAPPVERTLMLAAWRALFYVWSGAHRQHLNGTLDPLLFQAVRQEIATYSHRSASDGLSEDVALRQGLMRWAWASERFLFSPDFQAFVDELLGAQR